MSFLRRLFGALFAAHSLQRQVGDFVELCAALQRRIDALEGGQAALGQLPTEWSEMLDKLNRWSARESARMRRDIGRNLNGEPGEQKSSADDGISADPQVSRLNRKALLRAAFQRNHRGGGAK